MLPLACRRSLSLSGRRPAALTLPSPHTHEPRPHDRRPTNRSAMPIEVGKRRAYYIPEEVAIHNCAEVRSSRDLLPRGLFCVSDACCPWRIQDCWVSINNSVYDLTDFIQKNRGARPLTAGKAAQCSLVAFRRAAGAADNRSSRRGHLALV